MTLQRLFLVVISIFLFSSARAQKFELTPQYGYQIGAKYNYYRGHVKLDASSQFGLTAGVNMTDDITAEFMWAQQNTSVRVKDAEHYPTEEEVTDIVVNHYQIGAIHMFGYSDARPFAGVSAGWSTFNPEESIYASNTKFTFGVTGGIKYFFSDHVGIRVQTQLLVPVDWGGVYIGGGGGGVSAGGSLLQLNFSGGLVLAFGG